MPKRVLDDICKCEKYGTLQQVSVFTVPQVTYGICSVDRYYVSHEQWPIELTLPYAVFQSVPYIFLMQELVLCTELMF